MCLGGGGGGGGGINPTHLRPLRTGSPYIQHKTAHIQSAISQKVYKFITPSKKQQLLQSFYCLPILIR